MVVWNFDGPVCTISYICLNELIEQICLYNIFEPFIRSFILLIHSLYVYQRSAEKESMATFTFCLEWKFEICEYRVLTKGREKKYIYKPFQQQKCVKKTGINKQQIIRDNIFPMCVSVSGFFYCWLLCSIGNFWVNGAIDFFFVLFWNSSVCSFRFDFVWISFGVMNQIESHLLN